MLSKVEDEKLSEGTAIGSSGAAAGGGIATWESGAVDANRKQPCDNMGWAVARHDDWEVLERGSPDFGGSIGLNGTEES